MPALPIPRLLKVIASGLQTFEDLQSHLENRFQTAENLFYDPRSHLEGEWHLESIRIKARDWHSNALNEASESSFKRSILR